jgi:hypothetical protein
MSSIVVGGYASITVGQLANVCAARKEGLISFLALRIWLAAHEQRAKRCTAKGRVVYTVKELAQLTQMSESSAARALGQLHTNKLISWSVGEIKFPQDVGENARGLVRACSTSANRPVPIPRFILRTLYRHKRPSEVVVAIAHLVRCLFKKGQQICSGGLVKASWIAIHFGVGERSVHSARKWLLDKGLFRREEVRQFVLNRWGAKFLVNLAGTPKAAKGAGGQGPKRSESAPPNKTKIFNKISTYINHKPVLRSARAGVCTEKPSIRNILPEDLRKMPRLAELYRQAIAARWLSPGEANLKNFVCAALRANRVSSSPVRVFVGIVKKKLWHHVTQEQENRALQVLKRFRNRNPEAFGVEAKSDRAEGSDHPLRHLVSLTASATSHAAFSPSSSANGL